MSILLTALVALQSGATLPAPTLPRWEQVQASDKGMVAIDPQGTKRNGADVTVVSRLRFNEPSANGFQTVVMRNRYNCTARTVKMMTMELYSPSGAFMSSTDLSETDSPTQDIGPDSPNDAIAKRVCA